jgi:alanyl-tRNA synthetase
VVLNSTPFYAESGGQVGDTGILVADGSLFSVSDTQKGGKANVHYGFVEGGGLRVGQSLDAIVDAERRQAIRLNHSATHLMHAALRDVLGDHVAQKGSLVTDDRLRFDFSHYEPVTPEQLREIEALVNREIRANRAGETRVMPYAAAVDAGAIALFGEKYDDEVRVLSFGDFSVELCGGTHVERTGDIGFFKIMSEGGVAAGVRRIEATTGEGALRLVDAAEDALGQVSQALKSQPDQAVARVEQLVKRNKELEKELAAAKQAVLTGSAGGDATSAAVDVAGLKVLATRMDGADAKTLRDAVDRFKDKLGNGVVVLGSVEDGKVRLAAGVTKNNTDRIKAGELIRPVAEQVGGKGGGRPDFAQAGGSDPAALDAALESVSGWVAQQLGQA